MKRGALISLFVLVLSVLFAPTPSHAQSYSAISGWCEQGNQSVTIPGTQGSGTQKFMRSYPNCTVTVYLAGTVTVATIYSDTSGTAKANPFTASSTGLWSFFAAAGQYDVRLSGSGITSPFTLGALSIAASPNGYVAMVHDADSNTWRVFGPNGALVDITGTTSDGLQEAIDYAHDTNYPLLIFGGGLTSTPAARARITHSTTIVFPPWEGTSVMAVGEQEWHYTGNVANKGVTFDSIDVSNIDLSNVQFIYPGNACAVDLIPTNQMNGTGFIGMTSSRINLGTIAVVNPSTLAPETSHGYGRCVTPADHPIIGMQLEVREIQGGLENDRINSPTGSPTTGFEFNKVVCGQNHNVGNFTLRVGTSATNAARITGNIFECFLNTVSGSATALEVWGVNNTFNLSVNGGTGTVLQSSACQNWFTYSRNSTSGDAWDDNSTCATEADKNWRIDTQTKLATFPQVNINSQFPITQSKLSVNGSISVIATDADWELGAKRGVIDYSSVQNAMRIVATSGGLTTAQGFQFVQDTGAGTVVQGAYTPTNLHWIFGTGGSSDATSGQGKVVSISGITSASAAADAVLTTITHSSGDSVLKADKSGAASYGNLLFNVNNAERARLTTTGNMILGGTSVEYTVSAPGYVSIANGAGGFVASTATTNASVVALQIGSGFLGGFALLTSNKSGSGTALPFGIVVGTTLDVTVNGGVALGAVTGGVKGVGTINATGYYADNSTGASATVSVRKGDDSGACNLVYVKGLYISTTC